RVQRVVTDVLGRALRAAERAEEVNALEPLLRQGGRDLQAAGALHACPQLKLKRVVRAIDVVLEHRYLRELWHRTRVRRTQRAARRLVHRTILKPRAVARNVPAPAGANHP